MLCYVMSMLCYVKLNYIICFVLYYGGFFILGVLLYKPVISLFFSSPKVLSTVGTVVWRVMGLVLDTTKDSSRTRDPNSTLTSTMVISISLT